MSTYHYSRRKSKGVQAKKVAIGLLGVSLVALCGVGGNAYLKNKKIEDTTALITEVEAQKQELEGKIKTLQEKTDGLESEVKKIEETLWRFQPVIIPDSMK